MEKMLNKQLKKSGTPPIKLKPKQMGPDDDGAFNFRSWKIKVNKDRLGDTMTPKQFKDLAKTIYHEARHAEQWFAAAAFKAGTNAAGSPIRIPGKVAGAAANSPLGSNQSPMGVLGEATHRSAYGDGRNHRQTVLNKPDSDPVAYPQYRGLAEEQDAFGVDNKVRC